MRRDLAIVVLMTIETVPPLALHNHTFTCLGQNPNTSFGGNRRKKWPRNGNVRKKNAQMIQAQHHRRKV